MKTQLKIPKTIKIGYQDRSGTYTGKLAYIIYYDEKGVLRKQASWESWRDKKIEPTEFTNERTEGFVLNKKVGGDSSGWNHRNTYCRVYDPRGFEFEISVSNLLFILQETSSHKGKGLEGEFVYSWDGTELVLLPVKCSEFEASSSFTKLQSKKVTAKDMVAGSTYLTKKEEELIYVGRFDYFIGNSDYYNTVLDYKNPPVKKHFFYDVVKDCFVFENGFTKLGRRVTEDCAENFAEITEKLSNSGITKKITQLNESPLDWSEEVIEKGRVHIKYRNEIYSCNVRLYDPKDSDRWTQNTLGFGAHTKDRWSMKFPSQLSYYVSSVDRLILDEGCLRYEYQYHKDGWMFVSKDLDGLNELELIEISVTFSDGTETNIENLIIK